MHPTQLGASKLGCVQCACTELQDSYTSDVSPTLCVRFGLANVAGVSIVAGSVIPLPVEYPEHLDAVFVSLSVVRFVEIPVGVSGSVVVQRPFPARQTRAVPGKTDPEVAVTGVYKNRINSVENDSTIDSIQFNSFYRCHKYQTKYLIITCLLLDRFPLLATKGDPGWTTVPLGRAK